MWHVLSSVTCIYLCVEDMDDFIVVDFITKAVRAKVVQEQNDRFLHVLIITLMSILSVIRSHSVFLFSQKTAAFIFANFSGN